MADLEQTQAIFMDEFDDETDDESDAANKGPVAHLKILCQPGFPEKQFPLYEGDNVIGRQEGVCNICIPLKALSREHACVEIRGDSHLIYDKGSRNKTRRGKLFLSPNVRYELKHNDSLMFGDVCGVYLIENQKGDSGSETGSESMFQTAPAKSLDTGQAKGALEGTMVMDGAEEGYESDESVDLLQPTQAYLTNTTATLRMAPDSDEEDDRKSKQHNITVKDTPAPTRHAGISTLVLPESDSESEDEASKALKSNDIQTLFIEETQKDDPADGDILYAPTQAYQVNESDDDTTDGEGDIENVPKDIFTAATQAFCDTSTRSDNQGEDNSNLPTQTFVSESDDEDKPKRKIVTKEMEVTDDETTDGEGSDGEDVSHLFANPTLACNMEDFGDKNDSPAPCGMDDPTQAFSDNCSPTQTFEQLDDPENKVETLVIHEGATMAAEEVEYKEKHGRNSGKVVTEDDPTQAFSSDDDQTQVIREAPTGKRLSKSPGAKSKVDDSDDATQVISDATDAATVCVTDGDTVAVDATVAISDGSPHVEEKGPRSKKKAGRKSKKSDLDISTADATVAVSDETQPADEIDAKQAKMKDIKAQECDATQVFPDDATVAVSDTCTTEDATVAVLEENEADGDESKTTPRGRGRSKTKTPTKSVTPPAKGRGRKGKNQVDEDNDATQVFDDSTQMVGDATVAVEDLHSEPETTPRRRGRHKAKTQAKSISPPRKGRGRRGENQADEDNAATQVFDDSTQVIGDATVAVEDLHEDDQHKTTPRGRGRNKAKTQEKSVSPPSKGRGRRGENQADEDNTATQVFDDSTQVIDDATVAVEDLHDGNEPETTHKGRCRNKAKVEKKSVEPTRKGSRNRGKNETVDEAATQVFVDSTHDATVAAEDLPTQPCMEDGDVDITKKPKRGRGSKTTKTGGKQPAKPEDTSEDTNKTAKAGGTGVEATQVYTMETDEETPDIGPTQPYCMDYDEDNERVRNMEPTQPYCDDEKDSKRPINITEPTQPYCMDEEETPQLTEEIIPDSEESATTTKSPIIPLPVSSPHKSALASPKRSKSPSPKRVKFDVKESMSQNSNASSKSKTESAEPETSKTDNKKSRVTRGKIEASKEKPTKTTRNQKEAADVNHAEVKKTTRGRRSLPLVEEKHEEEKSSTKRGRRSVPGRMTSDEDKGESSKGPQIGKRGKSAAKTLADIDENVPEGSEEKVPENIAADNTDVNSSEKATDVKDDGNKSRKTRGRKSMQPEDNDSAGTSKGGDDGKASKDETDSVEVKGKRNVKGQKKSVKEVEKVDQVDLSESRGESKDEGDKEITKGRRGQRTKVSADEDTNKIEADTSVNETNNKSKGRNKSRTSLVAKATNKDVAKATNKDVVKAVNEGADDSEAESVKDDDVKVKPAAKGRGKKGKGKGSVAVEESKGDNSLDESRADKSVTETSVIGRTSRRGKKATNTDDASETVTSNNELDNSKNVPSDKLAKLKKTGMKRSKSDIGTASTGDSEDFVSESKNQRGRRRTHMGDNEIQKDAHATRGGKKGDVEDDDSQEVARSSRGTKRKVIDEEIEEEAAGNSRGRRKTAVIDSNKDEKASDAKGRKGKDAATDVHEETAGGGRGKKQTKAAGDADSEESVPAPSKRSKARKTAKQEDNEHDLPSTPSSKSSSLKPPSDTLTVSSPSLRRKSVDPKPKVLFTGVVDDKGQKKVKELGGELVSSVFDCTHLVTDRVRRTVKFLCCLSRGIPIVSPTWLESCSVNKRFVDHHSFLVHDTATEKQYKFSLQKSLEKASEETLLSGYKIHVTKSVKPEPDQMQDIIKSAGAEFLKTLPKKYEENTVVISCPDDKSVCEPAIKVNIPIVNSEFLLTGILKQETSVDTYRIFNDGNGRKRGTDHQGGGPAKRKR